MKLCSALQRGANCLVTSFRTKKVILLPKKWIPAYWNRQIVEQYYTNSLVSFVVVKAYQYTSLTSVMLLDCWAIPAVIFLTWMFLKTNYRFRKYSGVAICVAGLVLVVFSDVHAGDRAGNNTIISIYTASLFHLNIYFHLSQSKEVILFRVTENYADIMWCECLLARLIISFLLN